MTDELTALRAENAQLKNQVRAMREALDRHEAASVMLPLGRLELENRLLKATAVLRQIGNNPDCEWASCGIAARAAIQSLDRAEPLRTFDDSYLIWLKTYFERLHYESRGDIARAVEICGRGRWWIWKARKLANYRWVRPESLTKNAIKAKRYRERQAGRGQ